MKKQKVIPNKYLPVRIPIFKMAITIHVMHFYKAPQYVFYPVLTIMFFVLVLSVISRIGECKDESLINKN
ncbi:hypothetical protein [Wenyingzhuangia aestuarii]|uniref:hypothetical protein n=1 Tax=Wenyingzhuangia aestuarii TaxID=1647582 RepID=UPI00143A93F6|nr:hypothetical protein [Wenyingzhuangia aestuarii]NJB83647.1 hypothetical protein [Wenyingzhuangia aestuarii]